MSISDVILLLDQDAAAPAANADRRQLQELRMKLHVLESDYADSFLAFWAYIGNQDATRQVLEY